MKLPLSAEFIMRGKRKEWRLMESNHALLGRIYGKGAQGYINDIVIATNAHDDLVEALLDIYEDGNIGDIDAASIAYEALKKHGISL
jgi:hypothetical protein